MSNTPKLKTGTVHKLPSDLKKSLDSVHNLWNNLTPLARNEWICWVISAKRLDTRDRRVERCIEELKEGMKRPCCWIGCIHRTDKEISPSIKGILSRKRSI